VREDPVIDEIRAVRHQISEEFAHDIDRLVDYLIEKEKELAEKRQYRFLGVSESCLPDTKAHNPMLKLVRHEVADLIVDSVSH